MPVTLDLDSQDGPADAGPAAPVLRHRRDGILPTTAAALLLPGHEHPLKGAAVHRSAPDAPRLHPQVRRLLDGLGPADRERHAGRCPEAALISRYLNEGGDARHLRGAEITTRHIREDGDPQHGTYAPHCRSCAALLGHFGVQSVSGGEPDTGLTGPTLTLRLPDGEPPQAPGDLDLDQALGYAGWHPGRRMTEQAERWADTLSGHRSPQGHPHVLFPAAFETWAEYGGLRLHPMGPGHWYAPGSVVIDPLRGLHWARTLGDLGRALDTDLCPLGAEGGGTALLAMDREARIYALDHTGDWYLGPDLRTALITLLTGGRPVRLLSPE